MSDDLVPRDNTGMLWTQISLREMEVSPTDTASAHLDPYLVGPNDGLRPVQRDKRRFIDWPWLVDRPHLHGSTFAYGGQLVKGPFGRPGQDQ